MNHKTRNPWLLSLILASLVAGTFLGFACAVGAVVIGQYDGPGSLERLLDGTGGTRIHGAKEKP